MLARLMWVFDFALWLPLVVGILASIGFDRPGKPKHAARAEAIRNEPTHGEMPPLHDEPLVSAPMPGEGG